MTSEFYLLERGFYSYDLSLADIDSLFETPQFIDKSALSEDLISHIVLKLLSNSDLQALHVCRQLNTHWRDCITRQINEHYAERYLKLRCSDLRILNLNAYPNASQNFLDEKQEPAIDTFKIATFVKQKRGSIEGGLGFTLLTIPKNLTVDYLASISKIIFGKNEESKEYTFAPPQRTYRVLLANNCSLRLGGVSKKSFSSINHNMNVFFDCEIPRYTELLALFAVSWVNGYAVYPQLELKMGGLTTRFPNVGITTYSLFKDCVCEADGRVYRRFFHFNRCVWLSRRASDQAIMVSDFYEDEPLFRGLENIGAGYRLMCTEI